MINKEEHERITHIMDDRKKVQKRYSEETGKDWMVVVIGNEGYATWDYQRWLEDKLAATTSTEPKGVQITIKKEDNLKVAAWLMQNGIEYSSNPIEWNAKTLQAMKEAYDYYMSLMEEQSIPTEPKEGDMHGKTLEYWKTNAEENYLTTPISVLKYISILEEYSLHFSSLLNSF